MKRTINLIFPILCMFFNGCFFTSTTIHDANTVKNNYYRIDQFEKAFISSDGFLYLCLLGHFQDEKDNLPSTLAIPLIQSTGTNVPQEFQQYIKQIDDDGAKTIYLSDNVMRKGWPNQKQISEARLQEITISPHVKYSDIAWFTHNSNELRPINGENYILYHDINSDSPLRHWCLCSSEPIRGKDHYQNFTLLPKSTTQYYKLLALPLSLTADAFTFPLQIKAAKEINKQTQ